MPIKKPSTDNFTEKIQKITPKSIGTESVKFKDGIISDTVNSITSEIKNKVCGVIDLAIAIQSGISNIASSIGDINLESFINSGVAAVKDAIDDAKDLIEDTATAIADNAKNLLSEIEDQIQKLNSAATDLVDDVKILEKEQLSEFENTYSTNFSSRSNPRRRRR